MLPIVHYEVHTPYTTTPTLRGPRARIDASRRQTKSRLEGAVDVDAVDAQPNAPKVRYTHRGRERGVGCVWEGLRGA